MKLLQEAKDHKNTFMVLTRNDNPEKATHFQDEEGITKPITKVALEQWKNQFTKNHPATETEQVENNSEEPLDVPAMDFGNKTKQQKTDNDSPLDIPPMNFDDRKKIEVKQNSDSDNILDTPKMF